MRELSKFERELVIKICDDTRDIGGLLNDYLVGIVIAIDRDSDQIHLKMKLPPEIDITDTKYVENKAIYVTEIIVIIVNLLNYLTKEGYLTTYHPAHGISIKGNFVNIKERDNFNEHPDLYSSIWRFTDQGVKEMLFSYLDTLFIIPEILKDLVRNNFKTQEQIRHSQNLRVTWCSIMVAFLIGVIGLILTWQSNKDKTSKIDPNQFEIIQNRLNAISTHIDTLNKTLNENNPIKARTKVK